MPLTDRYRRGQPSDLQQGRDDVNKVVVLCSQLAFTFDLPRPRDNQRIGVAAVMRILLPALQWRIACHRPAHRIVRIGIRATELVEQSQHFLDRVRVIVAETVGIRSAVLKTLLRRTIVR